MTRSLLDKYLFSIITDKYLFFNYPYFCAIAKFATFEHWHKTNMRLQGKCTTCKLTNALAKISSKFRLLAQRNPQIGDRLAETGGDHE